MQAGVLFSGLRAGDRVTLYLTSGAQVYGVFEGLVLDWQAAYVDLDVSFPTNTRHLPPLTKTRILLAHVIGLSRTSDSFDRSKEIEP